MATSASLSNAFSFNPNNLSSRTKNILSLHHFIISSFPCSNNAFSSYPFLNSYRRNGDSRLFQPEDKTNSFFKPSVSAQQEFRPYQARDEHDSGSTDFEAGKRHPFSLKSLMQIYKEAILYGDEKTVYEIEDMISSVDKENKELVLKISDLSAEISLGKENYVRLQADFDNYRKRSEKEKITIRTNVQGEVIESLLPMVDSFERAKGQIKPETEREKKIDTSYQGIYKQFVEIVRGLRVTAVPTVGKPFDPMIHEAIAREESHEFKDGIVIQEFRRGFLLGERLLRPAMVKVSSGPGKTKPSSRVPDNTTSAVGMENP